MIFAYNNHGVPGSWGTVTTFESSKNSGYRHQIYADLWNSNMYFRVKSSDRGGWYGGWKHLLDSSNYVNYTVKKDGTGASGTWGINISGNASTASSATIANQAYNLYYYTADTDESCKNSKGPGLSFWYTKSSGTSRPTGGDSFMFVMGGTD